MKMTRFASFMSLLTLIMFLANGFTEDLPSGAIARINAPVNAIAYSQSANQLAIAAANNIHIHDADTYKELIVLAGHTDSVLAVAFSENGSELAADGMPKVILTAASGIVPGKSGRLTHRFDKGGRFKLGATGNAFSGKGKANSFLATISIDSAPR